jgi:hypothetical protein
MTQMNSFHAHLELGVRREDTSVVLQSMKRWECKRAVKAACSVRANRIIVFAGKNKNGKKAETFLPRIVLRE